MKVMMESRVRFAEVRASARVEYYLPIRKRSFDRGEIYDDEDGITAEIGLEYEPPLLTAVRDNLLLDQVRLERRLAKCRWYLVYLATLKNGGDTPLLLKKKPPPPPPPIPTPTNQTVWQVHTTEEGKTFYYNPINGESLWDAPRGNNIQLQYMYQDYVSGAWYWYNESTGETAWM